MSEYRNNLIDRNKIGVIDALEKHDLVDIIKGLGVSTDFIAESIAIECAKSFMNNCDDRNGYTPYYDLKGDIEKRDREIAESNEDTKTLSKKYDLDRDYINQIKRKARKVI